MKVSIKFLAIAALFFTFSFAANAQRGGGERLDATQTAEKQTAQMVEKLNLDEAQTSKIQAINLDYTEKMQVAHEENKENREAMKQIRTAIDAEKTAEMQFVLTETQFTAYKEMKTQKGKRGGGKSRGEKGQRGGR